MEKLRVALNGTVVGMLEKHAGGVMPFVYQEEWLAQAGARAMSLSLPLQPEPFRGDVVYNFFDNLLPDSELIRSRIQSRFRTTTKQPFYLLASIGSDCVGAIQLYPEHLGERRLMVQWWADYLDANRVKGVSPFDFAKLNKG